MELMANVDGSFAACLACGGAQADLMSESLQSEILVVPRSLISNAHPSEPISC